MNIAHFWRICDQLCRWLSTRELWEALCKENSAFLRSERARKKWNFPDSFCAYSAPLVVYRLAMVLPWAIFLLGLRPVFARNRLLVYNILKCYLAGFAPPLPVTSTVVHCPGLLSMCAKGTIFAKSVSFSRTSYKETTHARNCKATKINNTKIHWTLNEVTTKTTNKYKKTANQFAVSI